MDKTPNLIVSVPDSPPASYQLRGNRIGIGRGVDNQIQVAAKPVSSCHCELRRVGDDYQLVDLDSTNGTRVNGKEVAEHMLRDGDRLLLGETVAVHFVLLAEGEEAQEAAIAPSGKDGEALAQFATLDAKLQSIEADIAAKESEQQKVAADLSALRQQFEAKRKEHAKLLDSIRVLTEQIAAKRKDLGDSGNGDKELANLEHQLMLQTQRVQVLANDLQSQHRQMQAPPRAARPQSSPLSPASEPAPIKIAALTPPGQPTAESVVVQKASSPAAPPPAAPTPAQSARQLIVGQPPHRRGDH